MTENETPQDNAESEPAPEPTLEVEPAPEPTPEAAPELEAETAVATQPEEDAVVAESEEDEEPPVAYTVKEVRSEPGSVQRYCVEVQTETLDSKMEDILENLKKTVIIDGFRPGKAPLRLLKGRFGKDAQKDALGEMAVNVAEQIVEKDELQKIGDVELHDSKAEEGKPVELEIDIEVRPKLEIEGYTGGEYEVEVASVKDEAIDEELERIREGNATYEEPKDADKAYEKTDGATVDIEVAGEDGNRLDTLCQENVFLRHPSQQLPLDVASALVGKKPGETVTATVERTAKNRRGEDVTHSDTYNVTLKEVKIRVVPELDDDFAKDLGDFETVADLRQRVADGMNAEVDRRKRVQAVGHVLEHLTETIPFDAPKSIVALHEYQSLMRDTERMRQLGLSPTDLGMTTQDYLRGTHDDAERMVKMNLLISAIAEKEQLEVTDEDVDKEIERRAEAEGRKPLAIRARLEAEKGLDGLRSNLRTTKVEEFLMANNTIKIVEPKPPEPAAENQDAQD